MDTKYKIQNTKYQSGFTLMELLIYIGIFAGISVAIVSVLYITSTTKPKIDAKTEVQSNMRLALETINQKTSQAVSVEEARDGYLKLIMPSETATTTIFTLQDGVLYMKEGLAATTTLTSDKVVVDSLVFGQVFQPPAPRSVSVAMSMSYAAGGNPLLEFSSTLQQLFPIARAVTFDSGLFPNSDNSLNIGASGLRWNSGYFSGNISVAGSGDNYFAGKVGIGVAVSGAKLSLTTTGTELGGTAASAALRTMAGSLGTTAGNELALASIGFTSANQSSLGIRAYRTADGSGWETSSILLGMDVDATPRAGGAYIAIGSNGNIGIGTTTPTSRLEVTGGLVHITGGGTPTGGVGLELEWDGTQSDILSFSRAATTMQPLRLRGSTLKLYGSGTTGIDIDIAGNVGIGEVAPGAKLSVSGGMAVGSSYDTTAVSDGNAIISGKVGIGTAGPAYKLEVVESSLGAKNQIFLAQNNGAGGVHGWKIGSSGSTGDFDITRYESSVGTTKTLTILENGNVGIGTAAPGAKLDVAGTVKLGSAGTAFTAKGTCSFTQAVTTADATATCTGVPASASVAVSCSPAAALSAATGVVFRATGTLNQIALRGTAAANSATWNCMWTQP